jgi:hypothetical protein
MLKDQASRLDAVVQHFTLADARNTAAETAQAAPARLTDASEAMASQPDWQPLAKAS